MILIIKHRRSIYRRFQHDIWGVSFTDLYNLKIISRLKAKKKKEASLKSFNFYIRFFFKFWLDRKKRREDSKRRYIYRLDKKAKYKKRKFFQERFLSIRLTRLYFLMFEDRQFRKLFRRSVKSDGNYDAKYCYFLEGRIPSMFHRMNFTTNLLTSYQNLKKKRVIVDFQQIFSPHYLLPMGKLLSITKKWIRQMRSAFCYRIKRRAVLYSIPLYFFISFDFMFGFLTKYPETDDLAFPINIDLQRITGYY